MKIGIAADHGGFELKEQLIAYLKPMGYEIEDFGAYKLDTSDDYPDFIVPLAQAVAAGKLSRGIAVCGSGVGASVAANKIAGARAALITEHFSAHQGVEDDDLNIICLGGRITGYVAAQELVLAFLRAEFSGADRHQRRLEKVRVLEKENLN
ncbi:RpiB/LacA/LacB family sugar-phosphate isomerase [Pedobacter sp.]|jgi:ribose 5-phosphate isomerase B|uniref:RpiB/LacA/LacB family sugar-phosphate isomerase n=1 Tax=Pedobacter sp. TaxID=1411316 RepID=UPI002C63FCA2|nr:RpiB/LacA/LacB family sugar-phosphate isomerase [Pedobacter sp.]HWW39149.1 RpiB/LacA/LacB family sugar-phosphate isomerase [Pedobacter sp.]